MNMSYYRQSCRDVARVLLVEPSPSQQSSPNSLGMKHTRKILATEASHTATGLLLSRVLTHNYKALFLSSTFYLSVDIVDLKI